MLEGRVVFAVQWLPNRMLVGTLIPAQDPAMTSMTSWFYTHTTDKGAWKNRDAPPSKAELLAKWDAMWVAHVDSSTWVWWQGEYEE